MTEEHITVTIDGPSATGKSTVAKLVASKLGFDHLDTGAIYRCIAWWLRKNQINSDNLKNSDELIAVLAKFSYRVEYEEGQKRHFVGNEDVTREIRTDEIAVLASYISAIPEVRKISDEIQRQMGAHANVVVEGRDAGSIVFPKADAKFFLTANSDERARRRFLELVAKYPDSKEQISIEKVKEELESRDQRDRLRKHSPLKRPYDATIFDTTDLSPEEIAEKIVEKVQQQNKKKPSRFWTYLLNNEELSCCNFTYKLVYYITGKILRFFYRIEVKGVENIPAGKALIAPNHVSFIDPPTIGICIPFETHAVAQEYLYKIPIVGFLLRRLSTHPITGRTVDKHVIKTIVGILLRGKKVVIFPEGERSFDGQLGPIKKGIGLIASSAQCPVVPTVIVGAQQIWPRGTKFPKLHGKMIVAFGKPLLWEDYATRFESKKDAQAALLVDLQKSLMELLAQNKIEN